MPPEPTPTDAAPPHLSAEDFRALAHRMVDEIADYHASLEDRPVRPDTTPGDLLQKLPASPPTAPEPDAWNAIFADLKELIYPNLTHWQHPGFHAYFPCNASGPAILAEMLSAGLNVNGMLWATSPAATELETRMLDWCAELFGLPESFRSSDTGPNAGPAGCIQSTASDATLVALLAARQRLRSKGVPPHAPLAVYVSEQAHSSVAKAAVIAGIAARPDDTSRLRFISTDARGVMDHEELRWKLAEDAAAPAKPTPAAVIATCGTTGLGAFDPLNHIGPMCQGRAWLHVDAAWAGPAAACPEYQGILQGIEHADSLCINPHKWMLTNFDCDLFWTRDTAALTRALTVTPEYLRNAATDSGAATDFRDWGVALGRRFRALKLWFVLRHYGIEGIQAHIRRHIDWAKWLEHKLAADRRFVLAAPRSLSLVTFTLASGNDTTRALMDALNATGRFLLSHTTHTIANRECFVIRVAIGSTHTERRHIEELWDAIEKHA